MKLEHPDFVYLRAAQGWLELGDHLEANEELERISVPLRFHPDVLLVRYEVLAKGKKWEAAFYVSQILVALAPKEACGWINMAFALRKMSSGGVKAAWNALISARIKFPNNPIIPYHLACYACQMSNFKDAWDWLSLAFSLGDPEKFRLLALGEPDLEPLWLNIEAI